jgi:hypothetical protein
MKKITLLLFVLCALVLQMTAQSFDILDLDNNVINGNNIVVPVTVGGEADYYIKIRNNADVNKSCRISKAYLDGPAEGSFNTMCSPVTVNTPIGSCVTGTQTPVFVLAAREVSGDAHIEYEHGSTPGLTKIQYKVFDDANTSDYRVVNITFSTLTSVNTSLASEFTVFPNPAGNTFNIQHNFGPKAVVEIFNVLGKSVAKINSGAENTFSIDCSKWENGYYFCRLYNDGKIEKTIKLVVSH